MHNSVFMDFWQVLASFVVESIYMEKILSLYKNLGETPLQCLERFRAEHPEYEGISMTYAGRLDPMAEGLLLVLAGDEVHKKDEYLNLPKTYECEIVFGVETDTYDILGLVEDPKTTVLVQYDEGGKNVREEVEKILPKFIGKQSQTYPAYSSKPVDGKPLFAHAREGSIEEDALPTHEVEIFDITITGERQINSEELLAHIQEKISKVSGDFRQEEIKKRWQEVLAGKTAGLPANSGAGVFPAISLTISCGSGTYIRALAHDLGKALGTSAVLFSLKRTKIGEFEI
jgi:tRNA pseudouridine55 synthase